MIVWVHRFLGAGDTAQDLNCPIRNDLVRVHVGRRTRTSLEYIKNEVLVELSIDHFLSGFYDGCAEFPIQQTKINIRLCCGELEHRKARRRGRAPCPWSPFQCEWALALHR